MVATATGLAGFVATGSIAFACTVWRGKMTVEGNIDVTTGVRAATDDVVVHGANVSGQMMHCPPDVINGTHGYPEGKAAVDYTNAQLTITMAESTQCTLEGANKLGAGTYWVTFKATGMYADFTNVADYPFSRQYIRDCMRAANPPVPHVAPEDVDGATNAAKQMVVGTNGAGSGTYTLSLQSNDRNLLDYDSPFTFGEAAVCVSGFANAGGPQQGNQAPFFVF